MALHSKFGPGYVHAPHSWLFKDERAKSSAQVSQNDVGKLALQLNPFCYFILASSYPVRWAEIPHQPKPPLNFIKEGEQRVSEPLEKEVQLPGPGLFFLSYGFSARTAEDMTITLTLDGVELYKKGLKAPPESHSFSSFGALETGGLVKFSIRSESRPSSVVLQHLDLVVG